MRGDNVDFVNVDERDVLWKKQAACRGQDVQVWFPTLYRKKDQQALTAICFSCPVQSECLEYAGGESNDSIGVWGGLTGKRLIRARTAMAKGVSATEILKKYA